MSEEERAAEQGPKTHLTSGTQNRVWGEGECRKTWGAEEWEAMREGRGGGGTSIKDGTWSLWSSAINECAGRVCGFCSCCSCCCCGRSRGPKPSTQSRLVFYAALPCSNQARTGHTEGQQCPLLPLVSYCTSAQRKQVNHLPPAL